MLAVVVGLVGLPVVVNGPATEVGQDANLIHGLLSALFVGAVISQRLGTAAVESVEFARNAQAALVKVRQVRILRLFLNGLKCGVAAILNAAVGFANKGCGGRVVVEIYRYERWALTDRC